MADEHAETPITIDGQTVLARRESVAWVEIDGEVVIYDDDSQALHLLDTSGALVWQLLDGRSSLADLADDLGEAMSHDRDIIENDLLELTMDLLERSLVRVVRM